jgi:hypothetical protein
MQNSLLQLFRFNTKGQIGKGERMVVADGNGKLFIKMSSGSQTGPWELRKVRSLILYIMIQ